MIDKSELEKSLRELSLPEGVFFPPEPHHKGELSSMFQGRDAKGNIFTSQWVTTCVRGSWGTFLIHCDGEKENLESIMSKTKEAISILA